MSTVTDASDPGAGGLTELGETPPRVLLYGRQGCHLCDEARAVVAAVCAELGEAFEEVDVDGSEELRRTYGEEVPVTLVDGRQHDFYRVDPDRLRAALQPPAEPARRWRRPR